MAREGDAGAREGNRRRRDRRRRGGGDRPDRPEQREGQPEALDALTTPSAGIVAATSGPSARAAPEAPWETWPESVEPTAPVEAPAPVERVAEFHAAPLEVERAVQEPRERAEPVVHAPAPAPVEAHRRHLGSSRPRSRARRRYSTKFPSRRPFALTLPPESGLELVETRHPAAPLPDESIEVPAVPRRVRPPKVQIAEEPLQLVETQKENQPPAV